MKKRMMKIKRAASVFVLSAVVACAVAPTVQAYSFPVKSGSRGNNGGYYSTTSVQAYTDTGVLAKATAGAQISDTAWKYVSKTGTATATSTKTTTAGSANHAYGVNGTIFGVWVEN